MTDFTDNEQKKAFENNNQMKVEDVIEINFTPEEAVLLSPALGMPAIVKKEEDGTAILELVLLAKSDKLQQGNVAFHLRMTPWSKKDETNCRFPRVSTRRIPRKIVNMRQTQESRKGGSFRLEYM